MVSNLETKLNIHGFKYNDYSDESDSGKSFDDEHYKYKPPPIYIDRRRIITITPQQDNSRSVTTVQSSENEPVNFTNYTQSVVTKNEHSSVKSFVDLPPLTTYKPVASTSSTSDSVKQNQKINNSRSFRIQPKQQGHSSVNNFERYTQSNKIVVSTIYDPRTVPPTEPKTLVNLNEPITNLPSKSNFVKEQEPNFQTYFPNQYQNFETNSRQQNQSRNATIPNTDRSSTFPVVHQRYDTNIDYQDIQHNYYSCDDNVDLIEPEDKNCCCILQ